MWTVVTGGAGYIGSHVVGVLLERGHQVIIIDNFANSSRIATQRIREIWEAETNSELRVEEVDMMNREHLLSVFARYQPIKAVIHLAGVKAVGESVRDPIKYYSTNVGITCNLLAAMETFNVRCLVHSSSATVYGNPREEPIAESSPTAPLSPYGRSKVVLERIIHDTYEAGILDTVCILRYFNPVGAHPSGIIGEDPRGTPNNLMPAVAQYAVGRMHGQAFCVFGGDYNTVDGTGVRDYIHVMDLARGHVLALEYLSKSNRAFEIFNLGTGIGYSVLQVMHTFEQVSGRAIDYVLSGRRAGDVAIVVAAVEKARKLLGFTAQYSLEDMCRDHWRWQQQNPNGYTSK